MNEIKNAFPEFEVSDEECYIQLHKDDMDIYIDDFITIEVNVDENGPCDWRNFDTPRIRFISTIDENITSIKSAINGVEKFLREEKAWIQECRDVLKGFSSCQVEFLVHDGKKDVIFGEFALSNWKVGDEKIIELLKRQIKNFWK